MSAGMPVVSATGAVDLWHPSCWTIVKRTPARGLPVAKPRPRLSLGAVVVAGACAVIAIVVGERAWIERHTSAATLAALDLETTEVAPMREAVSTRDELVQPTPRDPTMFETAYPMPVHDGKPLDVALPSLHDWTHPVSGAGELMPTQASRLFGAERGSLPTIRPECGEGHCGVDLDGPRGRPIVAVADGTVVRLELHELGLDGRSGRFVKLEHDDGTLTAYMHLDDVAELAVGERVVMGQVIGTLGATAVFAAAPHLHFSLEVPNHPGRHGDNIDTHYIDPAPFLVRATVTPKPTHATLMHAM
jgi:murein DD-endopeptidase MepM/ murein hydrolase activator NlpD